MSKKTIEEVAKNIWEYAEIRFKEYKSAEELAEYAREAGFQVEMGIGGLETKLLLKQLMVKVTLS